MKKILFGIFCALLCSVMTIAQEATTQRKMQIKLNSGQTVEYLTKDVEKITFAEQAPEPQEFAIEFEQLELTSTSVKIKIKPNNNTTSYYVSRLMMQNFMQSSDGQWLPDKDLINTFLSDLDFKDKCQSGEYTVSATNLLPGAELCLVAFEAAAKQGDPANFKCFKIGFTVPSGQQQESQFTITQTNVGYTDASFHVVAKDASQLFMAWCVKKDYADSKGSSIMQNIYYGMQNTAVDRQQTLSQFLDENGKIGEGDFTFSKLEPNTEYTVLAYYVDRNNSDPTNVYDWNFTRLDFTTKAAEQGVTLEVTNVTKTANADGTVTISFHAKTTNAKTVYAMPKLASATEPYLSEDWEKWSNLFVGGYRPLPASAVESFNSETGGDYNWGGLGFDPGDYYLLVRAINEQGKTKTLAIKIE